jgi:hypothetical protein
MLYHIADHPESLQRLPKRLRQVPTVHETSSVYESTLGSWTYIGPHCSIVESVIDDYS